MLPEVMETVAGPGLARQTARGLARQTARLAGFRRRCLRGAVYPGLVPAAGECTEGVVWEGLGARMLARIDRFEGALYERSLHAVELADGTPQEAFVYVLRPDEYARAGPSPWDEADFRKHHLTAYLRGCRAFARENP
jgi:hypothetical protein